MNRRNWFISGLLLVVLVLALAAPVSGAAQAQTPQSRVRFMHAVAGGPMVDVYVDGELAAGSLMFGELTPHVNIEGGSHAVDIKPAGRGADAPSLLTVSVPLVPNLAFTVIVQGTVEALEASLYEDILDPIDVGFARLTAINAIADAPPLDVVTTEGGPLLQGVNYGSQFGTVNIGAGLQDLVIVPAGGAVESAIATIGEVPLRSGMLYTFVALGTLDGDVAPSVLVLESPVNGDAGTALVQVGHGSPDAPAVDVYAGDTLLFPSLALGELTGHVALPVGDYTVALRPAGAPAADAPVFSGDLSLSVDTPALTVVATGQITDETLSFSVFADDVVTVDPLQARFSLINAVPDAEVSAELADQTTMVSSASSSTLDAAPGAYTLLASVQGVANPIDLMVPEQAYHGGVYYTVMVYGGGASDTPFNTTVAGTLVNVTADSLFNAEPAMSAQPPADTATEAVTEEAMPGEDTAETAPEVTEAPPATEESTVLEPVETEVVTEEAPAADAVQDSEVVAAPQATEEPAVSPQPVQPQQIPIAYVDLDPSVNLQCRELPGSDKRSLGLIPGGTTLTVLGRTGTPLVPETGNATPEPTPEAETIEDLWLAVQWDTPGGGYLRCWVNAQFLRVEYRGRLLDTLEELWELPEEPFNRPGENVGADVTPPTPLFDVVIATVDLEPGISLQLRRFPNSDAESMELVPAQAQLEVLGYADVPSEGLVGQPTDPTWLLVRYRTENGGATVGWVSAQYVTLTRLGRPVELNEVPLVDASEPGFYEAPGESQIPIEQQKVIGVVDLNPGANLNLRDRPDPQARVVVGIPSGDSMELLGRNEDGTWVRVRYEAATGEIEGWVAAQYLTVARGGQPYDVMELPLATSAG